jgi:glycosyltransferase involved in cell wall biosynthesis
MKILYIITKAVVGGAQTSVLNLAREMRNRGHEVTVGFGDGDWLPAELDREKIPYVRFKHLKRSHNPLASLFFIREIAGYLRPNNFEIVHFNSSNALPGAVGAKLAHGLTRTVFTFRGMSMLDEHYQESRLKKILYFLFFSFFLLFIDEPVFVSQENLDKFGRGQLTAKGKLVYNGLDPARMNFVSRTEAINFFSRTAGVDLADKYIVGSIGRLDYAKNYEFLIEVFPKILAIRPDAVAVIMGEGDERSPYQTLIKEKQLTDKIFLIGSVENGGRFLKGFDLFVQPSRYEGLSIALIEALFAGLLILTSDVGGNREVLGNMNEEIFSLDNADEFIEKFKKLQEVDLWPKILSANAGQAAKFTLQNTADGYEKIYGVKK